MNNAEKMELLENCKGCFFTVGFIKVDGSTRWMNCRRGVKKYLVGGENKVVKNNPNYIVVYDVKAKGYRTVNLDTLFALKFRGTHNLG